MKATITKSIIDDIEWVITTSITASCGCNAGGRGKGYLGHDRSCWVHIQRAEYQRLDEWINNIRKEMK
jgi:hypothetical protein